MPTPEEIEAYERLTNLMGPTAAMLLVFLTVVTSALVGLTLLYIRHLKEQVSAEQVTGREWKNLYVGMLQGAGRAVTVADKLLDAKAPPA